MVAREKGRRAVSGGSFIGLNRRNDWMGRLISARDSAEQGQHPSWGGSVRIKGAPVWEESY